MEATVSPETIRNWQRTRLWRTMRNKLLIRGMVNFSARVQVSITWGSLNYDIVYRLLSCMRVWKYVSFMHAGTQSLQTPCTKQGAHWISIPYSGVSRRTLNPLVHCKTWTWLVTTISSFLLEMCLGLNESDSESLTMCTDYRVCQDWSCRMVY